MKKSLRVTYLISKVNIQKKTYTEVSTLTTNGLMFEFSQIKKVKKSDRLGI